MMPDSLQLMDENIPISTPRNRSYSRKADLAAVRAAPQGEASGGILNEIPLVSPKKGTARQGDSRPFLFFWVTRSWMMSPYPESW